VSGNARPPLTPSSVFIAVFGAIVAVIALAAAVYGLYWYVEIRETPHERVERESRCMAEELVWGHTRSKDCE
jgi:cytochrome c-type biogenesis protein CcmH/NrfG